MNKVDFFDYVSEDIMSFAEKEFKEHAFEQMGYEGNFLWCFVAKKDDKIIGVVSGKLLYGVLYIRDLVVASESRGKGLGLMLFRKALDYGKQKKCKFAYLETLSFQALDFYKRFGFEIDFERKGYDNGVSLYYLSKDL